MGQDIRLACYTCIRKMYNQIHTEIRDIVCEINSSHIDDPELPYAKSEYDHKLSIANSYARQMDNIKAKINDNS